MSDQPENTNTDLREDSKQALLEMLQLAVFTHPETGLVERIALEIRHAGLPTGPNAAFPCRLTCHLNIESEMDTGQVEDFLHGFFKLGVQPMPTILGKTGGEDIAGFTHPLGFLHLPACSGEQPANLADGDVQDCEAYEDFLEDVLVTATDSVTHPPSSRGEARENVDRALGATLRYEFGENLWGNDYDRLTLEIMKALGHTEITGDSGAVFYVSGYGSFSQDAPVELSAHDVQAIASVVEDVAYDLFRFAYANVADGEDVGEDSYGVLTAMGFMPVSVLRTAVERS